MKNKVKKNKFADSKEVALHYMKTLVDVARESFLILDSDLRVVSANKIFYKTFRVLEKETENKFIYKLGNGQWNIILLRNLLEEILPKKKVVRNYEVKHIFQKIGQKTMLLNARQIDSVQLIILAIEDITQRKELEEKMAEYARGLEIKVGERTADLSNRIKELKAVNEMMVGRELKMMELKKEADNLRKQATKCIGYRNGNGKNGNHKKNGLHAQAGNHKNGR